MTASTIRSGERLDRLAELEEERRYLLRSLRDLEREREAGDVDDEDYQTSLSGIDLYPTPFEHLARIRNVRGHPYEFYLKVGFSLVGVLPDANGPGKPDIFMAKRL